MTTEQALEVFFDPVNLLAKLKTEAEDIEREGGSAQGRWSIELAERYLPIKTLIKGLEEAPVETKAEANLILVRILSKIPALEFVFGDQGYRIFLSAAGEVKRDTPPDLVKP